MKFGIRGTAVLLAAVLSAASAGTAVYAQLPATGILPFSPLFDGPARVTMRQVTIEPGSVLGWHFHPGIGAYTVVTQGVLVVEDGCGGEAEYVVGDAFLEPPNRVHRGKNLGTERVQTVQTLIVPLGAPISQATEQLCGVPASEEECKGGGWMQFNHPHVFASQGDCLQFVITGR